ncbi:MAG TPA: YkgJ family cysteine cluster protein [Dehalococcoidia bacterium]|nr:YkgJ family cysteine cluster protein [Dehalococcoidia bacterium]
MIEVDFEKYGLSHLAGKEIQNWDDSDIDKLIAAFVAENIAPAIPGISFTPQKIGYLLALSHCRRCGKCCLPNPNDPGHPEIIVSEEDLRRIAKHTRRSYTKLRRKARMNTDPTLPHMRHIPLPCMFYSKGDCQIYTVRPKVCSNYPIRPLSGEVGITVDVRCDYGVDIYKTILDYLRRGSEGWLFR